MAYIGNAPAAGIVNSGNILDGSINTADLADAAVTAAKLAAAAITDKLGFTPLNKAGDTATGRIKFFNNTAAGNSVARFVQANSGASTNGAVQAVSAAAGGSALDVGHWTSSSSDWIQRWYNNVQRTEDGDVNSTGAVLVAGVDASGTFVLNSGKIKFPATQSASSDANTLDDYEEGTWSPVVRGSGTAGSYTLTSTYAHYTKIGRLVTLSFYSSFSSASGGSGYLQITGAPFSKTSNTVSIGTAVFRSTDLDANCKYCTSAFITAGATNTVYFDQVVDNGSAIDLPIASITTSSAFGFTISYITD